MKPVYATVFSKVDTPICSKIAYNSFREAQEVVNYAKNHRRYNGGRRINRKVGKKDKRPVRSYRCPDCGKWHLTSQPNEM